MCVREAGIVSSLSDRGSGGGILSVDGGFLFSTEGSGSDQVLHPY